MSFILKILTSPQPPVHPTRACLDCWRRPGSPEAGWGSIPGPPHAVSCDHVTNRDLWNMNASPSCVCSVTGSDSSSAARGPCPSVELPPSAAQTGPPRRHTRTRTSSRGEEGRGGEAGHVSGGGRTRFAKPLHVSSYSGTTLRSFGPSSSSLISSSALNLTSSRWIRLQRLT